MGGNPLTFSTSQIGAIVVLVGLVSLFVGLMCGLTPECVPAEEEVVEARGSYGEPMIPEHREMRARRQDEENVPEELKEVRLPDHVRPTYYNLTIQPDMVGSDELFNGTAIIQVIVTADIRYPRIHAKNLVINTATIRDSEGNEVAIEAAAYYDYNEFYYMDMGENTPLTPGEYTWIFTYTGEMGDKIVGFYKSSFSEPGGDPRYIAATDFEPTDARQAFPCFDEPNIKSYFKIKLIHESKYIGLSNMPEVSNRTLDGDLVETEFGDPEVKMSTYLVAFIVCDFDYVEGWTNNSVRFRVYAPDFQLEQAFYSLAVGINITDFYEDYFGVPYSISKLDMIAIPDFNSGAMENWGLITYRERYLLFDEAESSASDKQRICAVVAHELAHQWFGNIVTMDWWDDLWLNEGFASYVEYLGAAQAEPTWAMMDQFVVSDMYYVFGLDQIVSSHPIIVDVNRPEEITEVFDSIPYSKGASVLRMLNDFIGEEPFRSGLNDYLTEFAFANAKSADLWAKLQVAYDASDKISGDIDIADIMDTWTKQMGFPVVTVTARTDDELVLNQDWFLVDPEANRSAASYPSEYGYEWEIPFTTMFGPQFVDKQPVFSWMNKDATNVEVDADANNYYIANYEQKGFYRVNYEVSNWDALRALLVGGSYEQIPVADRSGLLEDAFNLARAEMLDYNRMLSLTTYLHWETEYVPWDAAYGNLLWLQDMLRYQPAYVKWRIHLQQQTKPLLTKFGNWSQELDHLDTFLRSDIIYLSCSSGDKACLNEASKQFEEYLNDGYVFPDVRSPVLRFGMEQDGGQKNWDKLFELYQATTLSSEKSRLMYGMARTREPWLLARFLEYAEDEDKIRFQDYFTVLNNIADNPVGNPIVWDYTRANWEKMVERFGIDSRSLGRLIGGITEFYSTELKLQQMEDFFAKYPEAGAGAINRQQALERVRTNIKWVERNADFINTWLDATIQVP